MRILADIFPKVTDLVTPGFETRFTNMEIQDYFGTSDVQVIDLRNIENSWQAVQAAVSNINYGLYVTDLAVADVPKTQVTRITFTGTSGGANVVIGGVPVATATFNTSLAQTAADFAAGVPAGWATAGLVVTHNPGDAFVTISGQNSQIYEYTPVVTNTSGDLAGTVAVQEQPVVPGDGTRIIAPTV